MYYTNFAPLSTRRRPARNYNAHCNTSKRSNLSNPTQTTPRANILKKNEDYIIELALPGFSKEDIALSIENNTLKIKSTEKEQTQTDYNKREFNFENFSRSFEMSDHIDQSKITANMEAGILTITLPRKEELKPFSINIK